MTASDLMKLHGTLSDADVMKYIEPPFTLEKTKAFLENAALSEPPLIYAAEDENGDYIGYVIYHDYDDSSMELGWVLNKSAWGKGYAAKLTEELIQKATRSGKNSVIECAPEQEVTKPPHRKKMFQSLGFIKTDEEWYEYSLK